MSIEVKGLTKIYGQQKAVNDLSFKLEKGEIVGFLGPNGAGKSTTMKMISCYLEPTKGTAIVSGHDIHEAPLAVQRSIGYLPESNPLYRDMYIREFLKFCCRIHQISNPIAKVEEIIELAGLTKEHNKKIGQLSKGYRQRVGLAQAIIHDPEVLILDEPTSGLDPNQLVEIRQLIKKLGEEKTVVFSSHIMQEVQALCQRVLIIHNGSLMVDTPIDSLQNHLYEESVVEVVVSSSESIKLLTAIPGLIKYEQQDAMKLRLFFAKDQKTTADVFRYCAEKGIVLSGLASVQTNVEDVFQLLTAN